MENNKLAALALLLGGAFYWSLVFNEPATFLFGGELYAGELRLWGVMSRVLILYLCKQVLRGGLVNWLWITVYVLVALALPGMATELMLSLVVFSLYHLEWSAKQANQSVETHVAQLFTPQQQQQQQQPPRSTQSSRRRRRSKSPVAARAQQPISNSAERSKAAVLLQSEQVANAKQLARQEQDARTQAMLNKIRRGSNKKQ